MTTEELTSEIQDLDERISITKMSGESDDLAALFKKRHQISSTLVEYNKLAKRLKECEFLL